MLARSAAVLAFAACCSAFAPPATPNLAGVTARSSMTSLRMAERVNTKIDLDSPKVATQDSLKAGDKCVYCRCWKSETFPKCDGAHMKHNEATGDNLGPLIVSVEK